MSRAAKCDHCEGLFVPVKGCVALEYAIHQDGNASTGYSPDDGYSDKFELCPPCSEKFLRFIGHDDAPESPPEVQMQAALKALCAWQSHPALTGLPRGAPVPDDAPSFDETVRMVQATFDDLAKGRLNP